MKAKSWKKFIPKEEKPEKTIPTESLLGKSDSPDSDSLLGNVLTQNETLQHLMAERKKLEQKMQTLTGESGFGDFSSSIGRFVGEIPSQTEKKKKHTLWLQGRKQQLENLKKRKKNDRSAPTGLSKPAGNSNLKSLDKSLDDRLNKLPKEKEDLLKIEKIKAQKDEWLTRKEKLEAKLKKAKEEAGRVSGAFKNVQKELERFSNEEPDFDSDGKFDSEITRLKKKIGQGADLDKKMEKVMDAFKKKRAGEKLDQKWEAFKEKKKKANTIKSRYEERKKRLLNVDRDQLKDLDKKRKVLQEKVMEKKRAEKKEEEKREQRREERKRRKKERF